ncbi:19833_t:CDS:1, partial [Gigaspora margarita]
MNRNLTFAFILLAALSMIHALSYQQHNKRGEEFVWVPCDSPIGVQMVPNPPVQGQPITFYVSGSLGNSIPQLDLFEIIFYSNIETREATWVYGDFACGGENQPQCSASIETNVTVTPNQSPFGILVAFIDAYGGGKTISCTLGLLTRNASETFDAFGTFNTFDIFNTSSILSR